MSSRTSSKSVQASSATIYKLPPLPSALSMESVDLLRASIPAHRALGAFTQCIHQSAVSSSAKDVFSWLNAAAAWQLDGTLISIRDLLCLPVAQRDEQICRYQSLAASATARLAQESVGSVLALELASGLSSKSATVRRSELDSSSSRITVPAPKGAERLQMLLENWQGFVQRDAESLDPLLVAAAAHGQWIAMRPFTHANIATGQLLTSLLLVEEGLMVEPVLPLTHSFAKNSDNYWKHLNRAIRDGYRNAWFQHFLNEVESSAVAATNILLAWDTHLEELTEQLPQLLPKTPSASLIRLCANPSFGISDLADVGITRRQTATAWMQRLVEAGVLNEKRAGKEKRYVNPAVLDLILN